LDFQLILLLVPVMLFSIIAHEIAHGYAALKQGDTTALSLGRLTWNPIKHIDPFMTIVLPIMLALVHAPIIGGAKPVPVNPRNYKHFKRGDIIVSLAGVFTNFLIALGCTAGAALVGLLDRLAPALSESWVILQAMMLVGIGLNLLLVSFNLIPIPPLDGSHVVKYLLPPSWAVQYQRIGFFGIIILLFVVRGSFLNWWFTPSIKMFVILTESIGHLVLPGAGMWVQRVFG
jgi:Zn-dependent protease